MYKLRNDLCGQVFGRLTVIERVESAYPHRTQYLCRCECGNEVIVRSDSLTSGRTLSCGCLHRDHVTTHGDTGTQLYNAWLSMRARCNNPDNQNYENYGGRGITICDDWNDDYLLFKEWSLEHGYDPDLSIDRIDNNFGYSPDNCRWVTMKEQCNNRRSNVYYSLNGETHTLAEWCDILGLPYKTIIARINDRGWSFEQAISTPLPAHYYE